MLPRHAEDIGSALAAMPREQMAELGELLGSLRDYLHARAAKEQSGGRAARAAFRDE
jgi:hypothetical protein